MNYHENVLHLIGRTPLVRLNRMAGGLKATVLAAAVGGYRCIFVMTEKASVEKVRYLKALGSDVVVAPATAKPGTPDHYVETARRIARETPNSFYPDQYSNPHNPEAHYRTTGPELWEQTGGRITHFVAGLGTGGTISGTG